MSADKSLVQFASSSEPKVHPQERSSKTPIRTLNLNLLQQPPKELDEQSLITAGLTDRLPFQKGIITDRSGLASDFSVPQSSPHINDNVRRVLMTHNMRAVEENNQTMMTQKTSESDRCRRSLEVLQSEDCQDSSMHSAQRRYALMNIYE
jgi:hypothetical protein